MAVKERHIGEIYVDGKKVGEIDGDDLNQESIMKAIAGGDTE